MGVVKIKKSEIEQCGADGLAVHEDVAVGKVPAAGAHHQHGGLRVQAVFFGGRLQADGALHGITQVKLAVEDVGPGRGVGVLKIGHEYLRPGVQPVDYHLTVHGAGDFHAAVEQVGGQRGYRPFLLAEALGFGQETEHFTGFQRGLPPGAALQQGAAGAVETPVQFGHERQRRGREDRHVIGMIIAGDAHPLRGAVGGRRGHGGDGERHERAGFGDERQQEQRLLAANPAQTYAANFSCTANIR